MYKPVELKRGGGLRRIEYSSNDVATVDFLLEKAKELFFPQGKSKYGVLSEMRVAMGNFQQEVIKSFCDRNGREVTFPEYLNSYGLYASRAQLYLMTTGIEGTEVVGTWAKESELLIENNAVVMNDVMLGKSIDENEDSRPPASLASSAENPLLLPAFALRDKARISTSDWMDTHGILVQYVFSSRSLYSDMDISINAFSREQCYEIASANDFTLLDTPQHEFQPPEWNFTISSIEKGGKKYFSKISEGLNISTENNDGNDREVSELDNSHEFLMADREQDKLIIHQPSKVWGYDRNQLVIAVVTSCPDSVLYTWCRNGKVFKEGPHLSCLAVYEEGEYKVKVQSAGQVEVSEAMQIVRFNVSIASQGKSAGDNKRVTASYRVPFIERSDLQYDPKVDEIGRGTFGAVYKATWVGTAVAVKQMMVRRVNAMKSVLESEVDIHSRIRHPNIVQIMAVALGKSSVYIVCELINGANLDELLFSKDEDTPTAFNLPNDQKSFVARQIIQAVAYLHNLNPPIIHRDIKPANVLVASDSYVTKLCDMGLGKIKSAQTTARVTTTGILGTPSYMAPECLIEKQRATTKADVWSLACTLVELFSGKDCWEDTVGTDSGTVGDFDAPEGCDAIYFILKSRKIPSALECMGPEANAIAPILVQCFNYIPLQRPAAIEFLKNH